jgi:hypothetical protein
MLRPVFGPNNQWLASAGNQDNIGRLWRLTSNLWNLSDPAGSPVMLGGLDGTVRSLVFDPNGRWLAISGDNIVLWDLKLEKLIRIACKTSGRNLNCDEWRQYLGHQQYRPTCRKLASPERCSSRD